MLDRKRLRYRYQVHYPDLVPKIANFLLDYFNSEEGPPQVSFDLWVMIEEFARIFFHHERHERLSKAAMDGFDMLY